LGLVVV